MKRLCINSNLPLMSIPKLILIPALLLTFSCSNERSYEEVSKEDAYSGDKIFLSIFFGYGELAGELNLLHDKFSIIENLNKEEIIELEKLLLNMTSQISNRNPGFFKLFKQEIISNDHSRISLILDEAERMFLENLDALQPGLKEKVFQIEQDIIKKRLSFENAEDINNYISSINSDLESELLAENMITPKTVSEGLGAASIFAAVAAAVYFVLAAHNAVAVSVLVYAAGAFWGPDLDTTSGGGGEDDIEDFFEEVPEEGADYYTKGFVDGDILRTEMLINEIANYIFE